MKRVQYIKWKNEIVGILQTNEEGIKYVISCGIVAPTELEDRIKE